jgi:hypothetical protein
VSPTSSRWTFFLVGRLSRSQSRLGSEQGLGNPFLGAIPTSRLTPHRESFCLLRFSPRSPTRRRSTRQAKQSEKHSCIYLSVNCFRASHFAQRGNCRLLTLPEADEEGGCQPACCSSRPLTITHITWSFPIPSPSAGCFSLLAVVVLAVPSIGDCLGCYR